MKYFKNSDLAKEYGVSLPTIANWIKDTQSGKKNLELIPNKDKFVIAKTDKNIELIQEYVSQGFKYKPLNSRVIAEPNLDYIKHLSEKQLIEIKKSIVDKKLLDIKFAYIDGGAHVWDQTYAHSQVGSTNQFVLTRNKMSILTIPRILELAGTKKVNIFEVGAGNGKPLLEFLHKLAEEDRLNSYTSIDISAKMNEMQKQNLLNEFPNLNFYSYVIDVENESFEDIVFENHQNYPETINIFILFGGTFGNFINPEKVIMNIEKSMLVDDLLCIDNPYPHPDRFKDSKYMYESPTVDHYLFASRSLGMQVNPENLEFVFDQKTTTRKLYLNVPVDHTIKLNINEIEETVDLPKGTKILVWQNRMTNLDYFISITKLHDLLLVLYTLSSDSKFILTVFKKESKH